MKKKEEHKIYNSNFIEACNNAVNGIIYAATTQRNIKIQLVIAVITMVLSLFYNFTTAEFLVLTFAVFLVIFAELVNTAIETLVDLYVDQYHPKAKIAKDVAAGAVVLAAINAIVVAYFLFFRETELSNISENIFSHMISSPVHLAFVGIILTVIAIVSVKAVSQSKKMNEARYNKLGDMNKNFIPSGQSALAFSILTAIWLNSKDIVTFFLALILSLFLVGNRLGTNKRSVGEIVFGCAMGVLIVLLVYGLTIFKWNI